MASEASSIGTVSNRPAVLYVGDWVVYPRLCRATRAETTLHLRAQVMDLLVVLARRPNEIVSKEEVAAALWPGVHVSASALSRCMAELRQVFGDDAKTPWLIETIAKRGYRVIAPVRIEEDDPLGASTGAVEAAEVETPAVEAEPANVGRRRPVRPLWLALGGTLLVVAGAVGLAVWLRTPTRPPAGRQVVILGDLVNTTGDKSFDAIRLALAVQLEQAPFLQIIPDARVRDTVALMRRPALEPVVGLVALEVCRRENAAVVLTSSISRLGTHLAVGVEAVECRQGESIARVIEQTPRPEGVLDAVGRVATTVRARLGESAASLRANDVPVARATTASLDALHALSNGDARRDQARFDEALEDYRQATTIDPQFAVAWARQGAILDALGRQSEASAAFTRAYELIERTSFPERAYITAHYHLSVTGRVDQAAEVLDAWRRLYPASPIAAVLFAAIQVNAYGRYSEALEILRGAGAFAADAATPSLLRASSLLALGRLDEARQGLEDRRFRDGFDDIISPLVARIAWQKGDQAWLEAEWARTAAAGGALAFGALQQRAGMAMLEGRLSEGRKWFDAAVAMAGRAGTPDDVARVHHARGLAEALLGHPTVAREAALAGLHARRTRDTSLRAALVLALAGDRSGARQALEAAVAAPVVTPRTDAVWMPVVRAAVDGIDDPDGALLRLDAVRPFETGFESLLVPLAVRIRTLALAERWQDAAAACRTFVTWQGVDLTSPFSPFVRLTLARALAKTGDVGGSREAYAALLASWRNAERGFAPLELARAESAGKTR